MADQNPCRLPLFSRRTERARRAAGGLACVRECGYPPSGRSLKHVKRINAAVAEFPVTMKIVFRPNDRNFSVFQYFRIPNPLQPNVFARAHAFDKFLVRRGNRGTVGADREQHRLRSEERPGVIGIVRGHVVKEPLGHRKRAAGSGNFAAG